MKYTNFIKPKGTKFWNHITINLVGSLIYENFIINLFVKIILNININYI